MKKRILSIALTLCMVLTLLTTTAFADTPISDFRYTVSEETGEVTITGYNGSDTDVVIPGEIDGYTVTAIGTYAFLKCQSLTGITLPNSVTSIGIQAFNSCTSLKNINIPGGVTSIGTNAFSNCTSLESIDIPDSVTYIGNAVFFGCSKLTSVTLSGSFTSIGDEAFSGCSSLTSIIVPNSVISIGQHAFSGCSKLTSVTLSDSLTSIGERAFNSCTNLTSINIPSNVTSVGNSAFAYCTHIESVFLPNGLDVTNAKIRSGATKVKYSLNNGEVTVNTIDLGTGKTSGAIPETICGYPVVAVAESEQSKVGEHKCPGDTATCINPKTCSLCGISFSPHSYTNEDTTIEGALKTAGTCKTEAVYYYSCINCGLVEKDDSHTFTGSLDSDNHTGTKVWEQNEAQHKQYYDCCGTVVVDYQDHTWNNGVCSVCDYICVHKDENPIDHNCDFCGLKLSECEDESPKDHNCDICGKKLSECEDKNPKDHNCDICGKKLSECEDKNPKDHNCDICGKKLSECEDKNPIDHNCDICGKKLSECEDKNPIDHNCDICGLKVSECKDENSDHICEICGVRFTECKDDDKDGYCDICGIIVDEYLVNPCRDAEISVLEAQTVKYCSAVNIKATATAVPTGYYLAIYIDGNQVAIAEGQGNSTTEVSYNVKRLKNDIDYTVKVVDEDGNVQKNADGVELLKDGGKITCKKNCIIRLLEILRNLIKNILRVVVNILKFIISLL